MIKNTYSSQAKKQAIKNVLDDIVTANTSNVHILFYGQAGTGKTYFSNYFGNAMAKIDPKIERVSWLGNSLTHKQLFNTIVKFRKHIIFIDEIHSAKGRVLEYLYTFMEGKKIYAEEFNGLIDIYSGHCIVAATTDIQKLPPPFVTRFNFMFEIPETDNEEISLMIDDILSKNAMMITEQARDMLIPLCWNNMRKLRITLETLENIARNSGIITENHITKFMMTQGIYPLGLVNEDIEYMRVLKSFNKPVALLTISTMIGKHRDYIMEYIEARLFKRRMLEKTSKGRQLTDTAMKYLYDNNL